MRLATDSYIYPSDNEWGIPSLRLDVQPERVVAPIVRWGSVSRKTSHGGTWCFYVDDYRFAGSNIASQVIATVPAACVEPNYSVFDWTSRAEALWTVYKKRRIARELQEAGVPVYVDVCVPESFSDLTLLGVPKGWRSYATRAFEVRPDDVIAEYQLAADHAGSEPLMIVYGGGKKIAERLASLPGTVHVKTKEEK